MEGSDPEDTELRGGGGRDGDAGGVGNDADGGGRL